MLFFVVVFFAERHRWAVEGMEVDWGTRIEGTVPVLHSHER